MILTYACPDCANRRRVIVSAVTTPRVTCACGSRMGQLLYDVLDHEYEPGALLREPAPGRGQ